MSDQDCGDLRLEWLELQKVHLEKVAPLVEEWRRIEIKRHGKGADKTFDYNNIEEELDRIAKAQAKREKELERHNKYNDLTHALAALIGEHGLDAVLSCSIGMDTGAGLRACDCGSCRASFWQARAAQCLKEDEAIRRRRGSE